jgi:hypothetical protein
LKQRSRPIVDHAPDLIGRAFAAMDCAERRVDGGGQIRSAVHKCAIEIENERCVFQLRPN